MDDVKKVNRKERKKTELAHAAEHIDGSLSRQCVSQFEYFSHSLTRTNACRKKDWKRGKTNEERCGAKIT